MPQIMIPAVRNVTETVARLLMPDCRFAVEFEYNVVACLYAVCLSVRGGPLVSVTHHMHPHHI